METALAPIQTGTAIQSPRLPLGRERDAERLQEALSKFSHSTRLVAEFDRSFVDEGIGQCDSQATCQVVVTGSSFAQKSTDAGRRTLLGSRLGRDHHDALQQARNRWGSKAKISMSSLRQYGK
jgi:hypothetical protein